MSSVTAALAGIFHPHEPLVVMTAAAIAVFAAYVTLELAGRIRASAGREQLRWLLAAAVTMGGGIWSMHFIAMAGLLLPFTVHFSHGLTLISLAVAIAVTAIGLYVAFWRTRRWPHYLGAGAIMGSGVAAMHYLGMGAMEYNAVTAYDIPTVALSVAVAVVAATVALWLAVNLRRLVPRIASAVVMGAAVVGMHFIGMAAFLCTYTPADTLYTTGASEPLLDGGVVMVTIGLLVAALASAYIDKRAHRAGQMKLAQFSLSVIAADDIDAVYFKAANLVCRTLGVEFAAVKEIDLVGNNVRCVIVSAKGTLEVRQVDFAEYAETSPVRAALRTGGPVQNAGLDSETRAELGGVFGAAPVAANITVTNRLTDGMGLALRAFSVHDQVFSEANIAFLRELVDLLAVFKGRDLAMQEVRLRDRALAAIAQGVTITDEQTIAKSVIYANAAFVRMTKYSLDQIRAPQPPKFIESRSSPGLKERLELDSAKRRPTSFDCRVLRADRSVFTAHVTASPIINAAGDLTNRVWVIEDVTEVRRRDDKLREMQRNETLGQLTGGVAHEFNNLLAVVRSNAEDIRADLKGQPLLHRQADMVVQAADRGATLVQQLLTYSRKKETEAEIVDVSAVLVEFEELLKRTLEANVIINFIAGEDLPSIRVDPGLLEDSILNLALNARDAMSQGGTLTIEATPVTLDQEYVKEAGVPSGTYVMVSVSDTGTGMTPEVMQRAFDPFFTTKEVGQGTGLGLSMVYGFVKQSGGYAKIYSEPGHGTTVKLYFPVIDAVPSAEVRPAADAAVPETGTGRILLVEDNELLRKSVGGKLERLGYSVTAAAAGPEGLAALENGGRFDLVFTDVIMPGMTGADLAREVQRRWPQTAILMTSGYTAAAVSGKVHIPRGVRLLSKPYSNGQLAEAIRLALVESRVEA